MKFFGFAKRMTEAQDLKSSVYQNVKTIIIDEYPIEKNKRYYLPNERNDFNAVFQTVLFVIDQILKFSFLEMQLNGIEYSPLFQFFDLQLPYNNDIKLFKENLILVQFMNNEDFRKDRENTLIRKTC